MRSLVLAENSHRLGACQGSDAATVVGLGIRSHRIEDSAAEAARGPARRSRMCPEEGPEIESEEWAVKI